MAVVAPPAATISVDGEPVVITEQSPFVALPVGPHTLDVAYNGHHPWREQVTVAPNVLSDVVAEPDETIQRKLAYASLGTAAASAATAIVLGVLSVVEFRRSRDLLFDQGLATLDTLQEYQDAVSATDDFRVGSGTAGGISLGLFVVGATLFVFDEPASSATNDETGQAWLRVGF